MDIRTMIGQRIALGFKGTVIPEDFAEIVRKYKVGNVILFRDNITGRDQLRALCAEIQSLIMEAAGYPAFITIDQEGGMVSRLPSDMVCVPGNMAVAAGDDPETAYRMARITARQLRGTGPNFNLAPVMDVNSNSANPVIGVRSYGDDPYRAAEFGIAAVRGYHDEGLLCCAKHFPGHGDTDVDSHLGLPRIDKSLPELMKNELIPFRAVIEAGIPAVMSSHILFPQIDPDGLPATMSRRIMHDLLREEMGFKGLILSDSMEMGAIQKHFGTPGSTVKAMQAGVDLVFVSSDQDLQTASLDMLLDAAENGVIRLDELEESYSRILMAKSEYAFTRAEPDLAGRAEDSEAARAAACAAVVLFEGPPHPLLPDPFFCGPKDYRMTNAANSDDYSSDFTGYMTDRFNAPGITCSVDPSGEEISMITEEAKKHGNIVMGSCNAHLYRGQLALAEALAGTGLPMTVIALRNPYDLREMPEGTVKAAVFDYTLNGLYAAGNFLMTGSAPGKMPVRL